LASSDDGDGGTSSLPSSTSSDLLSSLLSSYSMSLAWVRMSVSTRRQPDLHLPWICLFPVVGGWLWRVFEKKKSCECGRISLKKEELSGKKKQLHF